MSSYTNFVYGMDGVRTAILLKKYLATINNINDQL